MTAARAMHLEVSDLRGGYGQGEVLHGVSLSVRDGETVALLGRNGAGKTSTLRALAGLLAHRVGSIRLNGAEVIRLAPHRIARKGLRYVPEERGIFSCLDVEDNLLLPPVLSDGGMGLDEIYAIFPNLFERRSSPGTRVSGGEQQMLAIARVLRSGAGLLVLDEPTEGLAPVIVQRIGELMTMLRQRGTTILLVEQSLAFARRNADRFLVMEDGVIVDGFDAGQLSANESKLRRYLSV